MEYLAFADILERVLPEDDVEIPEWGGTVRVRAITNGQLSRAQRHATQRNGELDSITFNALIVEAACVEPKIPPGQYKALMGKEPGPITRIVGRIMELSGMGGEEEEQGEA